MMARKAQHKLLVQWKYVMQLDLSNINKIVMVTAVECCIMQVLL